jgi:hypothetical protein
VLVGEVGVETFVMTGQKRTDAGWTIGDIGAAADAGAGGCMGVGGSYICESASGRAGTFKCEFGFAMGTGSSSSSSEASASGSSSELISPSSS